MTRLEGAVRSRWRARPRAAARWSKLLPALRSTKLDKVFNYGIVVMRELDSLTLGWQRTAVAACDGEVVQLALGVNAGKLRCSSSEDEGTKGGGGLRRSFWDGRFSTGGGTPARR
jgi:hypothetical protein